MKFLAYAHFSPGFKFMQRLAVGSEAGTVCGNAMKEAIAYHIRVDTGNLRDTAIARKWCVTYPASYARSVWSVPPPIRSPGNPNAIGDPDRDPSVKEACLEALAEYARSQ